MSKLHVCPWWLGFFLVTPLRKCAHDPEKILDGYIKPGMKVIDYGCANGYFSLPMARMVGENGKVVGFDIQEKMIGKLLSRAEKAGLQKQIEGRLVTMPNAFNGMQETVDFALLFAVAHEVPDRAQLFKNISAMLKPGAKLLFAEPKGHVSKSDFEHSLLMAARAGLVVVTPNVLGNKPGISALLEKK